MKIKNIFILVFFVASCAWNNKEIKTYKKQSDLVEKFTVSNKQIDRFKEKPEVVSEKKPEKPKKKTTKKPKKKKKSKKTKKVVEKSGKGFRQPKDYPKKLNSYDKDSRKTWSKFKPIYRPGEVMIMDIKYLGITTGKVIIRTMPEKFIGTEKVYHYNANMKSAPFYSAIYKLDDHIDSYIKKENFIPLKYSLIQRESGQQVDDLQLFDHEERRTYFWYSRLKKGKTKKIEKKAYLPQYFQDSFSALFFVRALPLKKGDVYKFPVITRTKIWELRAEVMGPDNIVVNKKTYKAIKLRIETKFPGVLKKKGDINFWYSADRTRKLLKFNANVKIGNVIGDLADYYFEK